MDSITTGFIGGPSTVPDPLLAAAGLLGTASAVAQDATPLSKAKVEGIAAAGKKLEYVRTSDHTNVVFDLRSDGKVYHSPPRTQRNLSIQDRYTITDQGGLCFKMGIGQIVSVQDGCYVFRREGQKIHVYRARNPDSPIGDVVQ